MSVVHFLFEPILILVIAISLGIVLGVFRGAMEYSRLFMFHWFMRRKGRSFFVVSGDPATIEAAREVIISTLETIERQQQTPKNEGVGINDENTVATSNDREVR